MNRLATLTAALAFTTLAATGLAFGGDDHGHAPPGSGGPPPHGDGPRDHDGRDKGGRGDRGRPLTEAEIDLAIATLREIDPEAAKDLDRLRREDPERIGGHLREKFPRIREFLSLKERDPKMFELRVQDVKLWRQSRDLADKVVAARNSDEGAKADELADQLEALAEQHFEIRQQIRQRELERLEATLTRLREQLEERADDKDDLIEQHVANLIDGDRSEW